MLHYAMFFCINRRPNSVFQIRCLNPNETCRSKIFRLMLDLNREQQAMGLTLVLLVPIWPPAAWWDLSVFPRGCFVDVTANKEGWFITAAIFFGGWCSRTTAMCNYGLKKIKKVICSYKGVYVRHTEAETSTSNLQTMRHIFFSSILVDWIRDCGTATLWFPSLCSMSARQRGNCVAHYPPLGFFGWISVEAAWGPYNERGWNHGGQAEANSLTEQVWLEHKPHYSPHLRQDCSIRCKYMKYTYLCPTDAYLCTQMHQKNLLLCLHIDRHSRSRKKKSTKNSVWQ